MTILMVWLAAPSPDAPGDYPAVLPPSILSPMPTLLVPSEVAYDAALTESGQDPDEEQESTGTTDLFGNDIMSAVATYKVDRTGSLYELHSPRTEVPRVGIPKS